jgi:acyl-CoA oxidase
MPGCEMGDIGPKFGYNSKDNGYLILSNVRVPRENMLRRYIEVERDGNILLKGDLRAVYGIMMQTRVLICYQCNLDLGHILTIALRYAVVRRQFSTIDG